MNQGPSKTRAGELEARLRVLVQDLTRRRFDPAAMPGEIVRDLASLPSPVQSAYRALLAELVIREDADLWGVAVAALGQDPSDEAVAILESIVRNGAAERPWRRSALLALLNRGYAPIRDLAVDYAARHVTDEDVGVFLAQLVSVSPESSVEFGAARIAQQLAEHPDRSESIAQIFGNAYMQHAPNELSTLVDAVNDRDRGIGRLFSQDLAIYLGRPWVIRRFGTSLTDRARDRVRLRL